MPEFIHQVPGRIRVRVLAFKNDESLCQNLVASLLSVQGVYSAKASPLTGSLTVRFDTQMCLASNIIDHLSKLGITPGLRGLPVPFYAPPKTLSPVRIDSNASAGPDFHKALMGLAKCGFKLALPFLIERYFGRRTASLINQML